MTATAERTTIHILIQRVDKNAPILNVTGRTEIAIRGGTVIEINGHAHRFERETPVPLNEMLPGSDYAIGIGADGGIFVDRVTANPLIGDWIAGFHFAPGGVATGTEGGDAIPAIHPFSLWDIEFRPACPDPRGMRLWDLPGGQRSWADIYMLGVDHENGTSLCGAVIADGRDLPNRTDGKGREAKLDYATAVRIYAHHGKRLLTAEEFFTGAYGVKERCSLDDEPSVTGDLTGGGERFISRSGLFGVTGTMWQWGTDGHPDDPRPSIFGGSWDSGGNAGSRCADLDNWPVFSNGNLSARGACDHLAPV